MADLLRNDLFQQIECGITTFMHVAARTCSGDDVHACVLRVCIVSIRATSLVATAVLICPWFP